MQSSNHQTKLLQTAQQMLTITSNSLNNLCTYQQQGSHSLNDKKSEIQDFPGPHEQFSRTCSETTNV